MSIWEEIEKQIKKDGERRAVGEAVASSGGVVFRNGKRLIEDSLAAAELLLELADPNAAVEVVGVGAYTATVITLACSRLGYSLTLRGGETSGIFIKPPDFDSRVFISCEELGPILSGILSRIDRPPLPELNGEMTLSFLYGDADVTVSYSEEAALASAGAYAESCALTRFDRVMLLLPEHTPEGLFGGILAPLIKGAATAHCKDPRDMLKSIKLISPTKLFCDSRVASALLLKLIRIKKLSPRALTAPDDPIRFKILADPTVLLFKRLSRPRIAYALGGRLKAMTVFGEMSPGRLRAFFSFGIYAVTVKCEIGLSPAFFHYGGDRPEVWRLPGGSRADVCQVKKGGIGRILIYSPSVRNGDSVPGTYIPLEKHFDGEDTALITTFSGYVLKDGSVFEVK